MKKKLGIAIIAVIAAAAIIVQASIGQTEKQVETEGLPIPGVPSVTYKYSAKFICGDSSATSHVIAPATYLTAINIYNPQISNVTLKKKVVVALPEDQPQRPPSRPISYLVQKDRAFEIDCQDISQIGGITDPFFKGFVTIETPRQLDVVGVYTSINPSISQTTLDVEAISPKAILPSTSTVAADLPIE